MGRPRIPIDDTFRQQVERLASIACTDPEIAVAMDVSETTLRRRCRVELTKGREMMKISIKRQQFLQAQQGNTTMLIWLGKNYLGQSDRIPEPDNTSAELNIVDD